ncbi:MAG TPA: rhomboid family intramembrane serine protease [Burkholderiaceae bacterium]|nr:rhomboid family intramembrane serine protease [Burkholderiaceae bacterium]
MPPATGFLVITIILGYLLQMAFDPALIEAFALWIDPTAPFDQIFSAPWQLVTYSFLHGGGLHLGLNLFALWMFGSDVERVWGPRRFLVAYFAAVLTGAAAQILAVTLAGDGGGPMIGASAGIFGLLLCFGMLFPKRRIMLLIPPIPMQARTFVFVYAALELVLGVTGTAEGVAHFAHLGGLVGGWLVYRYGASLSATR